MPHPLGTQQPAPTALRSSAAPRSNSPPARHSNTHAGRARVRHSAAMRRWPATSEAWLSRLIAHSSVAGQSNLDLIEDVSMFFSEFEIPHAVIPGTRAGTANLYATVGPDTGSGVILSAHTDVVDAEPSEWSSSPFSLSRRGSRLYGRGATDMKGFIAVVLAALPALRARELRWPIGVALSADEELGVRGVRPMLDVLAAGPTRPAFCIVGEPTGMRVAVAHKGKIAFRLHFRSTAAHSSHAPRAVSAIEYAARAVANVYAYQSTLADGARDERFPIDHATVNVGRIDGGVSVNVVAPSCSLDGEIRALPSQDLDALLLPIRRCIEDLTARMRRQASGADARMEILSSYPGLDVDGDAPALVADLAGTSFGAAVDFGTEAGLFQQLLGVPVVVCGPGDIAQAHARDEYIETDQLRLAERFVDRIADWCSQ